tara:strand:- start:62103 stop:62303 length:201 start_codon:yes stop_codon:yes gene_type:complete
MKNQKIANYKDLNVTSTRSDVFMSDSDLDTLFEEKHVSIDLALDSELANSESAFFLSVSENEFFNS